MSATHPCAVSTARLHAGRGPAKGAVLPLRIDLIPDLNGSPTVGLSLVDPDGHLHPAQERSTSARALGPARCLSHHVWLASCPTCADAHKPEKENAR